MEFGLVACLAFVCAGCEPKLVVGEWACPSRGDSNGAGGGEGGEGVPIYVGPVTTPWSTSFETGFCDYTRVQGFCYAFDGASYATVTSQVHTGEFAAAFRANGRSQTRCVIQGQFPTEGYYSAWYLVPALATNTGNWNFLYFQGGEPNNLHGLWDISVSSSSQGELKLYVYKTLSDRAPSIDEFPPIPINKWFHIEVYFRRAADATGEIAVRQDGKLVYQVNDLVTDDTSWGQWYVGNLATSLMPSDFTVYVDDLMFRETL